MADQFIGLHMRVVLREPAGYTLTGTVRDVSAGASLTLTNVFVVGTKEWMPFMTLDATKIADLSEIRNDDPPPTYAPPPVEAAAPAPAPTRQAAPQPFADPAILSLGKRPTSGTPSASGRQKVAGPYAGEATTPSQTATREATPRQDVAQAMSQLQVDNVAHELDTGINDSVPERKKSKRRSRQKPAKASQGNENIAPDSPGMPGGRGKGWRQTPMLQATPSFQPFNSLKRNGKKATADNGWASEDVTEEMGDFDFENNLAKFDKHTIFEEMRKEDQVDDASRLVSHNRLAKPGTAGGKNLAYNENVLDMSPTVATRKNADFWNSEADDALDGAERPNMRELRGATTTRRADSKSGLARRSQSRKASATNVTPNQPISRVNSSQQGYPAGLYPSSSNTRLEAISTLQMLNLENIAANEIGFTEDLMAENAGRGIAEVAVQALSDPAMKVRYELATASSSSDVSLGSSTIVVLAGNNKSSIRALAAARHLRNKNIDVMVCLAGIEREKDLLEDLRRQITLYRNFGGKVLSKADFFEHLRKAAASGTQKTSVSLIIDALLGLTISFEELRVGDQATVYELMEWANRNEAFVLAVDIPTGIDPANGKIAIIDGAPLFVKPRYVVSIGAPKRGLLDAVTPEDEEDGTGGGGAAQDDEWRLFVADLGLGAAVWRKAGTKIRRGVDFNGKWVLPMEYRSASWGDEAA
ncbi:FDF domain-containing protein [Sarocladium implicatum]|nr:FDF domain-containing protein [Sarocladium implicatum]